MSVGMPITFDAAQLEFRIDRWTLAFRRPDLFRDLMEDIGSAVESQTRTRIQDEKQAPDGSDWAPWSKAYAGSQHGPKRHKPHPGERKSTGADGTGHSILKLRGNLLDSIQFQGQGNDEVLIGSNLKYANRQNAQRPFLGLSGQNETDLEQLVVDFFDRHLQ